MWRDDDVAVSAGMIVRGGGGYVIGSGRGSVSRMHSSFVVRNVIGGRRRGGRARRRRSPVIIVVVARLRWLIGGEGGRG